MELGLYTFGDRVADPHDPGAGLIGHGARLRNVIAAAQLADERGLDVFAVGEHHRLDCVISSPAVVLSAIATVTQHVKLSSATSVLPTLDPVRLFEDFATLDLVSKGRAEILAGRGAFTESFPLFGYELAKRDALFAEHLELLLELCRNERVTWSGALRTTLTRAEIAPRPERPLPVWVGVGVTPESAMRAGRLGLPMSLAILGTSARMKHLVDAYREAGGTTVGIASHCFVARTDREARDRFHPRHAAYFQAMGRQGMSRSDFDAMVDAPDGLLVGSPAHVAEKILRQYALFRHDRYVAQIDIGGAPFAEVAEAIELFAGEVAPIVRQATG